MKIGKTVQIEGNNNIVLQNVSDIQATINFEYQKYLNRIPSVELSEVIGRNKEITVLNNLLKKTERVVVVNGMGGSGKSTLAKAFIKTHEKEFNHLVWVNNYGYGSFKEAIINDEVLSANLFLKFKNDSPERKYNEIIDGLSSLKGNNLLVVDDLSHQNYTEFQIILNKLKEWKVIITSRQVFNNLLSLEIDTLSVYESVRLFYHYHQKEVDSKELEKLLSFVNGHALTIEILAKVANSNKFTISQLIQTLRDEKLKKEKEAFISIGDSIGAFVSKLGNQEKLCLLSLAILPNLDYTNIDIYSFLERVTSTQFTIENVNNCLRKLTQEGILMIIGELYRINPLMQQFVLSKMNPTLIISSIDDSEKFKEDLKFLIVENKMELAIEKLIKATQKDEKHNEVIILASQLEELNQKTRLGMILETHANVVKNQIRYATLVLIESIENISIIN